MTKAEKIELLDKLLEIEEKNDIGNLTRAERGEFQRWVKGLEQEPILDKIRAEIWDLQYGDEEKSMTDEDRADAYNNAIKQVIEILDKYKAGAEST